MRAWCHEGVPAATRPVLSHMPTTPVIHNAYLLWFVVDAVAFAGTLRAPSCPSPSCANPQDRLPSRRPSVGPAFQYALVCPVASVAMSADAPSCKQHIYHRGLAFGPGQLSAGVHRSGVKGNPTSLLAAKKSTPGRRRPPRSIVPGTFSTQRMAPGPKRLHRGRLGEFQGLAYL